MRMKKHIAIFAALAFASAAGWLVGVSTPAKSREPRFPQLTMEQLNDQQRPLAEYIMKISSVGISGPYNLLLRSPVVAKRMLDLLDYLRWQTSVPTRLNEFAILIQGRLWRSQVEWYAHYPLAIKAGISEQTAADLKANRRPADMKPDEAAVYDFCMELYTKHETSDATFDTLRKFLSEQQVIDLLLVSGTYVGLAAMLTTGEQGLPPGKDPPFKPGEP